MPAVTVPAEVVMMWVWSAKRPYGNKRQRITLTGSYRSVYPSPLLGNYEEADVRPATGEYYLNYVQDVGL